MPRPRKEPGFERYMFPSELAAYLGTTTRTIRRWMNDPTFPKPTTRTEHGHKMWSPEEARKCLRWRLNRT